MKSLIRVLAIVCVLLAGVLVVRMLDSEGPATQEERPPLPDAARATAAPEPDVAPGAPAPGGRPAGKARPAAAPPVARADHGDPGPAPDAGSASLVAQLNESPLSETPHRVLHAWGGPPGETEGPAGLRIVVDPSISTTDLERLVRDVRKEYSQALLFSTKVYDDEEAATYDKHTDGGAFADRHLVARVVRDPALDEDTILVRGRAVEP